MEKTFSLAAWDIIARCNSITSDAHTFYKMVSPQFKKFAFQKDTTTAGIPHWHSRASSFKKKAYDQMKAGVAIPLKLRYCEPTATCNLNGKSVNYRWKRDSRIEGPWTSEDPPIMTTPQALFIEKNCVLPWQEKVDEFITGPDDWRIIDHLVDVKGNTGKKYQHYLQFHGKAECLQYLGNYKDFLQLAFGYKHKTTYAINLSRGIKASDPKQRY